MADIRWLPMRLFLCALSVLTITASTALADIRADVRELFRRDMSALDFARVKIEVDRMIDPSVDMDRTLGDIGEMVTTIKYMLPPDADSWDKVETIRRYIYQAGAWNGHRPFSYDHGDPYGRDTRNKLLSAYIRDRRGNCVTMPFLFIALGQRLGLDVTPALAPLHVLVKFTDDRGVTHNLEATSGAGRARDQHYRNLLPITDAAVANGVFLTPLTPEQSVALIAVALVEDLLRRERYRDAMAVADILLEHYPMFAYAMVKKGTAAARLLKSEFPYATLREVPEARRPHAARLLWINRNAFARAEALGWRPVRR